MHLHVYSDFDGTIACRDVTDVVLERFARPEWKTIEASWQRGDIDSASCMAQQIALLEVEKSALDALLDDIEIDPGFPGFVNWCDENAIPLTVVSDGVDYFIERVLKRAGIRPLPIFANRLVWTHGRPALQSPWREDACRSGAGVCKCAVAKPDESLLVYVGDGRSDECVALEADLLFAKGRLAAFCDARDLAFEPFETFNDVREVVAGVVKQVNPPVKVNPPIVEPLNIYDADPA